ncbi:arylsulfatase A-like enzyme [Dyadobacter jejuensis]|uniref:Arylsulfatase A-like enzyme n=1 Tax=Dyadobacter jejuensis TaxID=1082580 RepID=A0A316AFY9_9BACT|nr:sulfatase [Dyadobacter jejuensis]PWJ56705.1 arylsulfatase A-like enzyme [Dyadobacter jejuensis]
MMKRLLRKTLPIVVCLLQVAGMVTGQSIPKKPNIVYVLVDQWRAQAMGHAGDVNAFTPNLDQLASESIRVKNAVSGMPVCSPHRASLLTGQYPLTHGVFMNDVLLGTDYMTLPKVFNKAGYQTGYIGKWHLDGHGRNSYIPPVRQQGFGYWKALECTHDYNNSYYYAGDSDKKLKWEGYDVMAQVDDACQYIEDKAKKDAPFVLFIAMGAPHDPYQTAPEKYKAMFQDKELKLNPNVSKENKDKVVRDLKGYYAHMAAIDESIGKLRSKLKDSGISENTIFVFTSDHGDLLGAHGYWNKQQPYEESIRVPFIIHYPAMLGATGRFSDILLNSPDIMPTLLGLTGIAIPNSVEGVDFSQVLLGKKKDRVSQTFISCAQPFGQWDRRKGGKEYRGIVTHRYTYTRDLQGPWLLFDNQEDPFQLNNLVGQSGYERLQARLEKGLQQELKKRKDEFLPGMDYIKKWNYVVDESETVPYRTMNYEGKPLNE